MECRSGSMIGPVFCSRALCRRHGDRHGGIGAVRYRAGPGRGVIGTIIEYST
jgi:hypothetical protein